MARPKKQDGEKRYKAEKVTGADGKKKLKIVSQASARCNLTIAEKAQLRQSAQTAGLSEADFIRSRILNHVITPPRQVVQAELIGELNSIGLRLGGEIGNNINQLAKAANSGRSFTTSPDQVFAELQSTMAHLHTVLAKVLRDGVACELNALCESADRLSRQIVEERYGGDITRDWKSLEKKIREALAKVERDGP